MRRKRDFLLIFVVFLLGLSIRLYFAFQGSGLIGADGFFHNYLVSETVEHGAFPSSDPFSWGGREVRYFPGFHLLLSTILISTKIPTSLLFLAGPVFFFIAFLAIVSIARKQGISSLPLCALFSTIPVLIWKTTTNLLPDSAVLFLLLISIFVTKSSELPISAAILIGGSLIHPIFFVAYVPRIIESKSRAKLVGILATLAVSLLVLHFAGLRIPSDARQNVPSAMQDEIFEGVDFVKITYRLGPSLVPMLLLFPENFLYFAAPLVPVLLKVIELDRGLFISALFMMLVAGKFISRRKTFTQVLVISILFFWSFYSIRALSWAPVRQGDFNSLFWTSENTPRESTIITLPGDGYLVAYVARRKNTIDGHFSGMSNSSRRLADVTGALSSPEKYAASLNASTLVLTSRTAHVAISPEWKKLSETGAAGGVFVYTG
ncbi:MAG: hypothetical protein V1820_01540 [archaeon]